MRAMVSPRLRRETVAVMIVNAAEAMMKMERMLVDV
jgi:hypothetical protein